MTYLNRIMTTTLRKTVLATAIGSAAISCVSGCSTSAVPVPTAPTATIPVATTPAANIANEQATSIKKKTKVTANLDKESMKWFQDGAIEVAKNAQEVEDIINQRGRAKNIILFVGDGMGISTVTASRILAGQNKGMMGEENELSFDKMPFAGLIKTYNTNQQTPDSAGTATAMLTGVKTKAGVLGVTDRANRATCSGPHGEQGSELVTALELASMAGKATGIVTTARLTHATPAAAYAKTSERNWESDDKLPEDAKSNGCKDIATQFVESPYIDVAFGGGRRHFIADTVTDLEGKNGKRKDGKDLRQVWQQKTGGVYVEDQKGFDAIPNNAGKVLGLFNSSHMQYEADRKNDNAGEPSLTQMTTKAIDLLSRDKDGYFMLVESGRIDHGHHAGSAYNALTDTIEFDHAIEAAIQKTSPEDTLIIVTADHSHVFTMAGYPTRGNPILGKVVSNDKNGLPESNPTLAKDDMPYTTLGYANGLGHRNFGSETNADIVYDTVMESGAGRKNIAAFDTTASGYHQEALVPLDSETHAGEDVGIYARGPGAHLVTSTSEQNEIFHIMNFAGNLIENARRGVMAK